MSEPYRNAPPESATKADADIREALHILASPKEAAYGVWRTFTTDQEVLHAVLVEISQVVLARRLQIALKETGKTLEFVVSNRHLLNMKGVSIGSDDISAKLVVAELRRAVAGIRHIKIDITERAPALSQNARSLPVSALLQRVQTEITKATPPLGSASLVDDIKTLSKAWIDCVSNAENGESEALSVLRRLSDRCVSVCDKSVQVSIKQPRLAAMTIGKDMLLIELEVGDFKLLAATDTKQRDQLLSLWRTFVAGLNSEPA
ncbi:hypothetical protein NBRC116594_32750 [Shimia sp. NS0008-38b]|uniref:hypothetical protein n=1 Tax=Shimia sp. NS0008-38b TaxID=3127653 RepID=UPI003106DA6F